MKKILFILAITFSSVAQAQVYRLETPLYSLGDTVEFLEWNLFEYPKSKGCNWRLVIDSPARRFVTIERTAIVPDSLILYLGGENEKKIPRWIENAVIKQENE